jgi:hypothetical protein
VRAQLLATEHWGLLAARSTAQSEVLTRISIFLTLFSAGLVSIALIGQATKFSGVFGPASIAVLAIEVIIGQLTQIRVINIGYEDLMYVLAMNRMRAAYVELEPGIEPYLMAGTHDDQAGVDRTYYFLGSRSTASHLGGSSMVLIMVVNAILLGLLGAAIALTFGAPMWLIFVVGGVIAVAFFVVKTATGARDYAAHWRRYSPLSPTPAPDAQ